MFDPKDLTSWDVVSLRNLQSDIVNWQASKPVDNAPKPATQSAAAKQDAEVKAKIEKAKAESVAQSAIETPVVVAQLTDEDKARIKAQESRLQAMYTADAVGNTLEDPFAD